MRKTKLSYDALMFVLSFSWVSNMNSLRHASFILLTVCFLIAKLIKSRMRFHWFQELGCGLIVHHFQTVGSQVHSILSTF